MVDQNSVIDLHNHETHTVTLFEIILLQSSDHNIVSLEDFYDDTTVIKCYQILLNDTLFNEYEFTCSL